MDNCSRFKEGYKPNKDLNVYSYSEENKVTNIFVLSYTLQF